MTPPTHKNSNICDSKDHHMGQLLLVIHNTHMFGGRSLLQWSLLQLISTQAIYGI
jgi:hypothetical protein